MRQETVERTVGSVVLGIFAGAASFCISFVVLMWVGLSFGFVKVELLQKVKQPMSSYEIATYVASLTVAALSSVLVFRHGMKPSPTLKAPKGY